MSVFTVYKTMSLSTGQFYIGVHETNDPNDGYLGSGIWVKRAFKKYGRGNFLKDVLFIYPTEAEAYAKEVELIKSAHDDTLCMNFQDGGRGGFRYINGNGLSNQLKAAYAGGKKASESGQAAKAAAIGRQRMIESGLQKEKGRILGNRNVESGFLARLRTPEHQAEAGRVAGRKNVENKKGIHGFTLEQRAAASRIGGRKNAESGQMAALGKSKSGHHIRWHVNRNTINLDCALCVTGVQQ